MPLSFRSLVLFPTLALTLAGCGIFKKDGANESGDTASGAVLVFPDYVPNFKNIAKSGDGVDTPQDLDFHPDREGELWVVNKGTEDSGSDVVIIMDATEGADDIEVRKDGNAWHFMNLTSAMAFSDDSGNWATSPEVTDANHMGGTFTGPSMWSSNLDVFAMPSAGNGSHLDMLHQSPNSMGIAHEKNDVYWVFDGYTNELVRYNFVDDHGPGGDDHSDAKLKRYSDVPIKRVEGTPSHMVVDKTTNWMYIADTKKGRILRMDVTSGDEAGTLQAIFETVAEYLQMENEVWEVFAEGLSAPCGIDVHNGTLYVTDNDTNAIIAYNTSTGAELGRMNTEAKSIMGIKMGPDGLLYYVDRSDDKVVRVERE
jgi:hypothetical protein